MSRAGHVTLKTVFVWENVELDTITLERTSRSDFDAYIGLLDRILMLVQEFCA